MGRGATAGMGTKGRGALAGLRRRLDEAVGALESAKQAQRAQEYLARDEAIRAWEAKERAGVLVGTADKMQQMEASGAGVKAINAVYREGQLELNSISRIADQRLRKLRDQYRSGETMTPE
jgi:hypothetical protein